MAIDLLTAVNRFILNYASPVIPQERVYRGYQNRTAIRVSMDGEDYCVYAISDTRRIGTNITTYTASSDAIGTRSMREYVVDIDFASSEETPARERAERIETLARSFIAVDYFKQHQFGLLFADDIKPLPYVLSTEQYVYRYRVTLHITGWLQVEVAQEYFEDVKIGPNVVNPDGSHDAPYLENVDVHHLKKSKE